MDQHPPFVFHPSIRETIAHVTACVKEDWYKVGVERAGSRKVDWRSLQGRVQMVVAIKCVLDWIGLM